MEIAETTHVVPGLRTTYVLRFAPGLRPGIIHHINIWDDWNGGGEADFEYALKNGLIEKDPNTPYHYRNTAKGRKHLADNGYPEPE